jgi:hypothetical protein
MGFHLFAKNFKGEDFAYFHLNDNDKERILHKALGVPTIGFPECTRPYSKGKLLDAKSYLNKLSNTLDEIDFVQKCLTEINLTANPITITFN